MTNKEFTKILQQGESYTVEFKRNISKELELIQRIGSERKGYWSVLTKN